MSASTSDADLIQANYRQVLGELSDAASAAGRKPGEIRLIAVTKYVGIRETIALVEAGCLDLGESRPQSLWEKFPQIPPSVRWHFIGHLQRNKVKRTLPMIHLLHSLDSIRLTDEIEREASNTHDRLPVLLEIHIAQEATKTGMPPEEAEEWMRRYVADESLQQRVELRGLMGMASLNTDASQTHREFASLRSKMEAWNERFHLQMSELSMGMSQDFAIAIAEGSTMVRIGSRLFEGVASSTTRH